MFIDIIHGSSEKGSNTYELIQSIQAYHQVMFVFLSVLSLFLVVSLPSFIVPAYAAEDDR